MGVTRGVRNLLGANQRYWLCMLSVLFLGAVHADFALQHLLPTMSISDRENKIWFDYIQKFLWKQLMNKDRKKCVYLRSNFLLQLWIGSKHFLLHSYSEEDSFSSFQQIHGSKFTQNIMWVRIGKKLTDESVTKVSGKFLPAKISWQFLHVLTVPTMQSHKVIHTWQFSLQKFLSINISFAFVALPTGYRGCEQGSLSVQTVTTHSPQTNLVYCGEHSCFNVYPASTSVVVRIEHMLIQTFEVHGSFSVCNRHKVFSCSTSHSGNFKTHSFLVVQGKERKDEKDEKDGEKDVSDPVGGSEKQMAKASTF